ncbi:MAG: hypothetical protein IJO93_01135 [Clostridia bacterium]|nr:hypothetical protein [Clostridia bacterium]
MKGALLMTGEEYFTDMKRMLTGVKNVEKYNWLITDFDGDPGSAKLEELLLSPSGYCFLPGEELLKLVKRKFQWEWAMLTAFKPTVKLEEILRYELPKASNETFFDERVTMQHPFAEIELIAYDSSMFICIAKSYTQVKFFREKFPLSVDLHDYNVGM